MTKEELYIETLLTTELYLFRTVFPFLFFVKERRLFHIAYLKMARWSTEANHLVSLEKNVE